MLADVCFLPPPSAVFCSRFLDFWAFPVMILGKRHHDALFYAPPVRALFAPLPKRTPFMLSFSVVCVLKTLGPPSLKLEDLSSFSTLPDRLATSFFFFRFSVLRGLRKSSTALFAPFFSLYSGLLFPFS